MDFNTHVRRSTVTTVKKSDKKSFSKQQESQKVMFSKYGQEKKSVKFQIIPLRFLYKFIRRENS